MSLSGSRALSSAADLGDTYGALLIGTFLGLALYGFALHQMYRYYRLYPEDKRGFRILVVAIMLFQTVHMILCMVAVYYHLVTNYARPATLPEGHWSTRLLTPFSGVTIVLCQGFYAYRVFIVGPQLLYRAFVVVDGLFMASTLGLAIAAAVLGFRTNAEGFRHGNGIVSAIFGSGVAVDVLLTGTLVVVLLSSRSGFRQTDSLVHLLVIYAINTGLMTSIIALLVFILAIASPGNLVYVSLSIIGTKLYANSVLAALNSRRSIQDRMMADTASGSNAYEMSSFIAGPRNAPRNEPWATREVPISLPADAYSGGQSSNASKAAPP